jgi:hypothetical protein
MVSLFRYSNKLVEHLKNMGNHIQLMFPYVDYGLDYKDEFNNSMLLYESKTISEEINKGKVIPNLKLYGESDGYLRDYLLEIFAKSDVPLMLVLTDDKTFTGRDILLFESKLTLCEFKYEIIEVVFEGFDRFDYIIVRPDFIVEVVKLK